MECRHLAAAAAVVALGALLRHPGLACVCLTAKFRPDLGDSELEVETGERYVASGCGGLLISERQWGRSEAIAAQSDTAVGRPKKRRCLLMVRPYVMSGAGLLFDGGSGSSW